MMADDDDRNAVEVASAYLDGQATADERARVENDAALMAQVERLRQIRRTVGAVPPAPGDVREAAIAAALSVFDELPVGLGRAGQEAIAPSSVVPLGPRRQVRIMQAVTATAAAAVLVIGAFVIANRGTDEDSTADEIQAVEASAPGPRESSAALAASSTTVAAATPTTTAAARTTAAAAMSEGDAAATGIAAPDAPMAAVATEAASASSPTAAAEPPAAVESATVLRDADDLRAFAEGLADEPPPVADVLDDCERGPRTTPDAVFEDATGGTTEVVVATTVDGYAAVAVDDCTILLRSSSEGPSAEG
jgi:hypothetical protein